MRYLDVGAPRGPRSFGGLPFHGWDRVRLNVDAAAEPDIVLDPRELAQLEPREFDGVLSVNNLQKHLTHDAGKVLKGFVHVLKPEGFAELIVPDAISAMRTMISRDLEPDAELYATPNGPVSPLDVLFGNRAELEKSGLLSDASHTAFSVKSLRTALRSAGFAATVVTRFNPFGLRALAFVRTPSPAVQNKLGIRL